MSGKKRVVKLDQKALRGLIKEAIQGRQPGSPLFTPPPEKRTIREGAENNFPLVEAVTEAFRAALDESWGYDPSDPSMAATGEEAWQSQKDAAVEHFMNDVSDVVDNVVNKLIQGEYHY